MELLASGFPKIISQRTANFPWLAEWIQKASVNQHFYFCGLLYKIVSSWTMSIKWQDNT
jgi:hypothetical protein